MSEDSKAEPLNTLIRKIRQPATLRELMASCLRSIYMGDPFSSSGAKSDLPEIPSQLIERVIVTEETIAGVRCAIYTPKDSSKVLPVLFYMHGGGFVIGSSEDTDYTTRNLCHSNQMLVVSINYRLAPETVFPGAVDDCENVLKNVIADHKQFKIDSNSVYLAGDSAGANLALSLLTRLGNARTSIKGLILFAPWLDMAVENYESYNRLAPTGIVFDAAFLGFARAAYVGFENWKNPEVSPILLDFTDLPPAIVIVGSDDPLVDQTLSLKQKALDSDCSHLQFEFYEGMPHCFYSFPSLFKEEEDCFKRVSLFINETNYLSAP
ncbi:MAG: alpha/beta hydrolase [Candidatus Obscuribacterales bacterium]